MGTGVIVTKAGQTTGGSGRFVLGSGGESDTSLANRIVIPGLSGSPDVRVAGTNDDEFDTTWTGSGNPTGWTAVNCDTTHADINYGSSLGAKSYLFLKYGGGTDKWIKKTAPGIPFTMTAKMEGWGGGIFISDGDPASNKALAIANDPGNSGQVWTFEANAGFAFANDAGNLRSLLISRPKWLRFKVTAANNIDVQYSEDARYWKTIKSGDSWLASATVVGLLSYEDDGGVFFDWVRFS